MTLSNNSIPLEIQKNMALAKSLKEQFDAIDKEIREQLLEAMQSHDVYSIKNDKFTITRATRNSYSAENPPKKFTKSVLDTTKVSDYEKLYGKLPNVIDKTTKEYITWRSK